MEGNDLYAKFDNKYVMYFDEALNLIKSYFAEHLPLFILTDEFQEHTGYWGVKYSYKSIFIFIGCGRGNLEYEIAVNNQQISLSDFEPLMENVKLASEINIRFTLGAIKRFVENIR
jgi:hypothetical protein